MKEIDFVQCLALGPDANIWAMVLSRAKFCKKLSKMKLHLIPRVGSNQCNHLLNEAEGTRSAEETLNIWTAGNRKQQQPLLL